MGSPCAENRSPVCARSLPETLSPTLPRYPCMASMEVDPELSDTLMHLSGYIFRARVPDVCVSPVLLPSLVDHTTLSHPDGIEPDPAGIVRHADGGEAIITS